ncbi:hypothetical protein Tco_1199760 [Tanacetum coccineum]
MSALRHSDIENKLAWLVLTEPEDSYKYKDGDTSFQLNSDSFPHAHAQTTKTYYKHQDSRIKKAQTQRQRLPQTLIYKIFLQLSSLSMEIVSKLSR